MEPEAVPLRPGGQWEVGVLLKICELVVPDPGRQHLNAVGQALEL